MDRFSFLNAAHTQFFADLYEQYTSNPDSVEPSWRAFFQGFDFGMATYNEENLGEQIVMYASSDNSQVSEKLQKEFNVLIFGNLLFLNCFYFSINCIRNFK